MPLIKRVLALGGYDRSAGAAAEIIAYDMNLRTRRSASATRAADKLPDWQGCRTWFHDGEAFLMNWDSRRQLRQPLLSGRFPSPPIVGRAMPVWIAAGAADSGTRNASVRRSPHASRNGSLRPRQMKGSLQ
jgi:type IV secretory pathway protease TraF